MSIKLAFCILNSVTLHARSDLVRKTRLHTLVEEGQADDNAFEAIKATGRFTAAEQQWARCMALSRGMSHFGRKVQGEDRTG